MDYRPGDLRELPVADQVYDAIVNWFTSFGYFDDDETCWCCASFIASFALVGSF